MKQTSIGKSLALGAITGMRSMAGATVLAANRGGPAARLFGLLAAGEMLADKTAFVPDRIEPLPLAGRAVLGALAGGFVAHEARDSVVAGALIGAAAAVAVAHLAYHLRRKSPLPNAVNGMIEDVVVTRIASSYI